MEFTAERESLLSELNLFSGVVQKAQADQLSAFSNVTFRATETGCEITAVGNDLAQLSTIEAEASGDGALSLPLGPLTSWLKACRGDSVSFKETEENWTEVECGAYNTRIPTVSGGQPEWRSPPEQALTAVSAGLLDRLLRAGAYAFPAHDADENVGQAGAQLEIEGPRIRVVSMDHSRLVYSAAATDAPGQAPPEDAERELLVLTEKPVAQIKTVARADDCTVRIFQSENHLFFEMGKRLIVASKPADALPDYAHVIPRDFAVFARVNREHLRSALEAAQPFTSGKYQRCKFQVDPELIRLEVNSVRGEQFSSVEVLEHRGKPISMSVNLAHFLDFSRQVDSEFATLEFQTPEKAFVLRPNDGAGTDDPDFEHFCVGMPLV